ncbi:MAG TPA: cohesin domain-containing protein, partial [Anaerolineae bacterium]|nr:cohesin domain-containing protein [Anaerolineae bacterium]
STKFREVTVPVLTWEAGLFDDMNLASQGDYLDNQSQINITNTGHPLAADLSGQVIGVTAPRRFFWGAPGSNALKIATLAGDSSKVSIFAYEEGTPMVGLTAPARRVGFFNGDGPDYTAASWQLFDAAVNWALNCETTEPSPTNTPPPATPPTPTNTPSPVNTPTPTPIGTPVNPSEAGTLMIDAPSSAKSNDTFAVAVVAKDLPDAGLYGVQLEIDYDPAMVSVSQLKPNTNLPFVLRETVDNNSGKIIFVASRQGDVVGLAGEAALFTFQATAAGTTGTITFEINQAKVSDPQALPITMTTEEATISVTEGSPNPTPLPTGQPTAIPTTAPSPEPTAQPSPEPTIEPEPTATAQPSPVPTTAPAITTIFGQVILSGRADNNWGNAVVTLNDGSSSDTTDASGNFSLTNITVSAPASITADAPGYLPAACTITVITSAETGLASVSLLSGDINSDLEVDISDATAIGASFGQTGTELTGDINLDTVIDIFDLVLVATNFGKTGLQEWICQ